MRKRSRNIYGINMSIEIRGDVYIRSIEES